MPPPKAPTAHVWQKESCSVGPPRDDFHPHRRRRSGGLFRSVIVAIAWTTTMASQLAHALQEEPEGTMVYSNRLVRGCLHTKLGTSNDAPDQPLFPLRVCNSEDPANATEIGLCRPPEFDHLEIRIKCQVRVAFWVYAALDWTRILLPRSVV